MEQSEGFRLSPQQRRAWALARDGGAAPAVQAVVDVGALPPDALAAALEREVAAWEIFRTGFMERADLGMPLQTIAADGTLAWRVAGDGPEPDLLETERRVLGDGISAPGAPVLRVAYVPATGRLLLTAPALCADALTLAALALRLTGEQPPPGEAAMQYADLAEWLNDMGGGDAAAEARAYWHQQGVGAGLVSRLPYGLEDRAAAPFRPASVAVALPDPEEICAGPERLGAPLRAVLLAAWQAVLARLTQFRLTAVAVAFDGRRYEELAAAAGPLQRSLPLPSAPEAGDSFAALVGRTAARLEEHEGWQDAFSWEWFAEPGGRSQPSLPFAFADHAVPARVIDVAAGDDRFHVRLRALRGPDGPPRLVLDYDAGRLARPNMERLAEEVATLLTDAVRRPSARLDELEMVGPVERRALLEEFNRTATGPLPAATVHDLIAQTAARASDATAVACGADRMTYAELERRATGLAYRLAAAGARPGAFVAVMLPRGIDLLVALLGVLKSGGAYLPIDPAFPEERVGFLLDDAAPAAVVTDAASAERLASRGLPILCIDADAPPAPHPLEPASADDLAYVLYTSGSTGKPKGALITHRGVVNYLVWAARFYRVADGGGAPVHSPVTFDLTVTSLFAPLTAGRTVTLLPETDGLHALLDGLVAAGGHSLVKITPAHLDLLRGWLPPERAAAWTGALVIGGEALFGESLTFWRAHAPNTRLINEYGPTETVVGCCVHEVPPDAEPSGAVPIGRPIDNMRLYVLDGRMRPVPTGVPGEIHIGGPGVARGYLNRPELTAERFVADPFAGPPHRLYRTGDLGRHRADGLLEYVGRRDDQVKVHGYRIELGEVEAALLADPDVATAAATVHGGEGPERRLVAYAALRPGAAADGDALRARLAARLPAYMLPSAVLVLDALPLTHNGKVDRAALPPPHAARPGGGPRRIAPRDAIELELVRLWEDALAVRPIGVADNFFDLGGHSLLAVQLMARVHRTFGQELPLAALFAGGTVEHLATLLRRGGRAVERLRTPLVPIQPQGSRRPFFCVHPTGGNVLCYVDLARHLGPDQPFYGLQDPDLFADGDEPPPERTIEAMAARYVAAVRSVQSTGPYLLGGWSSGGAIAYEMASRLRDAGDEVLLLALIDSAVPFYAVRPEADEPSVGVDDARIAASAGKILARLSGRGDLRLKDAAALAALTPDQRLDYLAEVAEAVRFVPAGTPRADIARLFNVFKGNIAASRVYRPRRMNHTITLFRASDPLPPEVRDAALNAGLADDEAYLWQRLSTRQVQVVRAPGDHFTMMTEPNVAALARLLRRSLDEVQAIGEQGWGVLSWAFVADWPSSPSSAVAAR